ncbi:MAG: hypothetical protein IPG01_01940 [Chitinophagaceae bacterium]|nr:hypothetical protein [Chitinophagaceae bacterium]
MENNKYVMVTREGNDPSSSLRDSSNEEKLDEALRFLSNFYFRNSDADSYIGEYVEYGQFWKHMDSRSIYRSECLSMILFLEKDGKIEVLQALANLKGEPQQVRLSFEGLMWFNSGGYVQEKKDTDDARDYKLNYESKTSRQTAGLIRATWAIVIATAVLALTEILSWTRGGH